MKLSSAEKLENFTICNRKKKSYYVQIFLSWVHKKICFFIFLYYHNAYAKTDNSLSALLNLFWWYFIIQAWSADHLPLFFLENQNHLFIYCNFNCKLIIIKTFCSSFYIVNHSVVDACVFALLAYWLIDFCLNTCECSVLFLWKNINLNPFKLHWYIVINLTEEPLILF